MTRILSIQYLRAFAAVSVVAFHAAERTQHHFAIGAAGVDIFFVISGFIMWVVSDAKAMSPARFLADRIRRIVPIYWLATATIVAGGLTGLFPNLVLDAGHILASLLFIPARSPSTGDIWPVLVQGWTLNYEMFFYLIFAASLFLPRRVRLASVVAVIGAFAFAGGVSSFENPLLLTYTDPILLEFAAGMVIGEIWLRGKIPSPFVGIALSGVSIGGFALIWLLGLSFGTGLTGPLAAALVVGALSIEKAGYVGEYGIAKLLGDASYSIYLWHTFALAVVVKAAGAVGFPGGATMVLSTVVAIAVGILAYWIIERPLLRVATRPSRVSRIAAG